MKKTIIKSSLFAIICLLAVSSKSFAQTSDKQKADPCKDHGGTAHTDTNSKGDRFTQCHDGKTSTSSGDKRRKRK